ncbi:MAG: acyl-CoA synthetase FdrA, partial [Acidobacteriota bacterium]|nr:acyl-CoA synthetase FdrA [Acidobacteriota bacterium]
AGVVMATEANLDILRANSLLPDDLSLDDLGADDLLLVVRAESESAAQDALERVDELLVRRSAAAGADSAGDDPTGIDYHPKSLRGGLKSLPEAVWVLISTPGRFAAGVAQEALESGRHVFLYSDNVSIEDEARLKGEARERGLLVMGPDCGTAMVQGVGLGFANRVRRGPIGIVAAAGTGLQAVATRVHSLGHGVSHALGTGGRDLSEAVGGATALQGLDLLARDPETRVVVLVSKPPAPAVASRVLAAARGCGKPVVVTFSGLTPPVERVGNVRFARGLDEAARMAVEAVEDSSEIDSRDPAAGYLRGLFSGGTLALEVLHGLAVFLDPVFSNLHADGVSTLDDPGRSRAHTILDLGADEFTVGRLHPMIDPDLRNRRVLQESADPEVALILLDVVLGEGAHANPAEALAPVVRKALERTGLEIVVLLMGTEEDPQNLEEQGALLGQAGALIFRTNEQVIGYVAGRVGPATQALKVQVPLETLTTPFAAVNVGLEMFYSSLVDQEQRAVHVDWRPPAGGNERLAAILKKLKS